MKKNDVISLTIDDLGTDGQGIGHSSGMAVFVPGALPGETVSAQVILVKKSYAVAKVREIVSPSPLRVQPPCHVFSKCGGCTLQHLAYAGQLDYKQDRVRGCLQRTGKSDVPVSFPLPSVREYRYRNKAAFPVRMQDGKPEIGFYAAHSHRVVDVDDCKIQHGDVAIVMSQLRVWIVKHEISVYDETTGQGLLRHIVLRTNTAGEIMLVLVINGDDIPHRADLLMLFTLVLPQVKTILLNINKAGTNVIMGEENICIHGRGYLMETIGSLEFRLGPNSFLQVNAAATEVLYKNLFRLLQIEPGETVLDLFCGIGAITLAAAKRAKWAFGVEIVPEAVENARFNARLNEIGNVEFFAGDANVLTSQIVKQAGAVDVVIVDPPRKGLSEPLIQTIVSAAPKRIGYVSCDPATLARDLALFARHGYPARAVQPVDLFPQTTHVETVCLLSHK